jgi:hypothetical protein
MLRKMFSLGALVVVAVTFGVGNAAAKQSPGSSDKASHSFDSEGFSDGRFMHGGNGSEGFSDGRF